MSGIFGNRQSLQNGLGHLVGGEWLVGGEVGGAVTGLEGLENGGFNGGGLLL